MPRENAWNVQSGLYTALAATNTLLDLLPDGAQGVRDHVPPDAAFPYIVIGDNSAQPMDTQGYSGLEIIATIHSYSRAEGMKEIKHIMHAVQEALHDASFVIEEQVLVMCREISSETFLDAGGEVRRGVQRFRIITEASA